MRQAVRTVKPSPRKIRLLGLAAAAAFLAAASPPNPLAPLSEAERPRCVDAARRAFQDVLGQDRFALIRVVPVHRRSGGALPRTCQVELFDYAKSLDLQATIDLGSGAAIASRRLQDVRPAAGQSEVVEARRIGEAGAGKAPANAPQAAARNRLGQILQLQGMEVNALVRTDLKGCSRHRCLELNYFQVGPDAGTVAVAEPPGERVTWRGIQRLARVVVDLTSGTLVSTEVF